MVGLVITVISLFLPFEFSTAHLNIEWGTPFGKESVGVSVKGADYYSERPFYGARVSILCDFTSMDIELGSNKEFLYIEEKKEDTSIGQTVGYRRVSLYSLYRIMDYKSFSLMAMGGPSFLFGGENVVRYIPILGELVARDSPDKNSFCAFTLGTEIRWNNTKPGSFFIRAGYSYHFAFSKKDAHNYYMEHPLIISVSAGIRIRLYSSYK